MIGTKFMGRYEIVSKLGSGGMAVVYKAVDTVLNRMVTVKIMQEQLSSNQQFVVRFRKEAQAVAALSHPNIVKVYDVGCSEEGEHYLIMEYVEGRTLKEVIQKNGSLSVSASLDYVNQILAGLRHAHSYGVIHRDIKPQNIMITPNNQVKIMDFGLALNLSDSTMTYDSTVFGSVHYIAPEIAQKGTGDARADIYSTGIVLYEMLTGELPFSGESPITIALQHVEGKYAPVDEIDDDIPYEVARIVDKTMAVDPEERYHSVKSVMRDIERAATQHGIRLSSVSVDENDTTMRTSALNQTIPVREPQKVHRNYDFDEDEDFDLDDEEDSYNRRSKKNRGSSSTRSAKAEAARKKKKKKIIIGVIIGIVLLSVGIFAGVRAFTNTGEEVEVPKVEGEKVDVACDMLDELGIKYNINYMESDEVEVDYVISQSIKAGQKVKAGRTIELAVSTGSDKIEVPDVVGDTEEKATKKLEGEGFKVKVKEEASDTVKEGRVISQDPEGGEEAGKNATVTIVVSTGKDAKTETTTVPNVTGLTLEDAEKQLKAKGLNCGKVTEKYSSEAESGYVYYQSINAGTTVEKGTTVDLTVSKGTETKSYNYSFVVPQEYDDGLLIIVCEDERGSEEYYHDTCSAGQTVRLTIDVTPPGRIIATIDGSEVDRKTVN
ncbi:MAG: Stk1 family PASTA domain-containing Ser/Thr kinase [Bacillota bacterium]|nr:Stk1 family PASTA domain-containing Ser/Thr kinase [Bacillota bacterium]